MFGKRLHDLFAGEAPTARAGGVAQYGPQYTAPKSKSGNPAKAGGGAPDLKDMVNPQLVKIARDDSRIFKDDARKPRRRRDLPKSRPARSHFTPYRSDVVEEPGRCCRRSTSSSPARAARTRCCSACARACG
jgi:ATP-dependent RNA helicase HelY